MKTPYEAYFFDFDGVLADSVEVKTNAFSKLFEKYGPDIQARVVAHHRRYGGMTRYEKINYYYKDILNKPLSETDLHSICERFARLVVGDVINSPEIPGATDFIKKNYSSTFCFVVSATPESELREIVRQRGLNTYFIEVRGAPITKSKHVETLLRKYMLTPNRCLFFGDAEGDYHAAQACGVNFIGILPGPDAPLLKVAPDVKWMKDFTGMNEAGG